MLKNHTIARRKHRILWRMLAGALFAVIVVSMWAFLEPEPGPMEEAITGASNGKIGSWALLAGFAVYGAVRFSSYVTGTAIAVVHSGRHLLWQMPMIVTGLAAVAVGAVFAVPLTGQILQLLSLSLLLSALVRWLLEITDPANAPAPDQIEEPTDPPEDEELSGADRTHEKHEPHNDSTIDSTRDL